MIIITGASRGIGAYLFEKLNSLDESVIGIYNKTKPIKEENSYYQLDITDEEGIKNFVEDRRPDLKNIILLNCAGVNYSSFAHKADIVAWKKVIDINLTGTFLMIKFLLPIMREESFGRIINFSSVVAQKGVTGTSAYSASKSALWGLTRTLAIENASKNVTVNNLNLGYFAIGMIDEIPESLREQIKDHIPMKRFGSPDEILRAVQFLSSSNYITGTSIDINGGII